MSQELTFRLTKEEDAPLLKSWLLSPGVLNWFPLVTDREIDDSIRFWMTFLDKKCSITTCLGNTPVGMSNLYLQNYEKVKHQTLFVICGNPEYYNRGYGAALLKYMIQLAEKEFGITLLHLEVYEGNPAIRLYERLGFEKYGCHKRFLKDQNGAYRDKILMQKKLGL
ncbi:MAG: GNAT family protein [Simkaniaceae bacterium]